MLIYLWHPVQGIKIANLEAEAAYDEENGWTRYELGDKLPFTREIAENVILSDDGEAINSMPPRRRGRPPINREL